MADTDDLVQDTLLQTFKRIESFEPRGWAHSRHTCAKRCSIASGTSCGGKARRPASTDLEGVDPSGDDSPLEQAIGREAVENYERALQRLKPEEREAIVARVELGYSYEELAEVLAKPSLDAARKSAQRALLRLAEEMKVDRH